MLSDPKERGDYRNELIRPRVSRQEDVRKMISALEDQLAQQEPWQLEGGHHSSGAHTMETSMSSWCDGHHAASFPVPAEAVAARQARSGPGRSQEGGGCNALRKPPPEIKLPVLTTCGPASGTGRASHWHAGHGTAGQPQAEVRVGSVSRASV